jgi:hypothetical protein
MPTPWTPPPGWKPDWTSSPMTPPGPLTDFNDPGWWDFLGPSLQGPAVSGATDIEVSFRGPTLEWWAAAGDAPAGWQLPSPPGKKLLPDGRDFTLYQRACPHVRWEEWLFGVLTIAYWRIEKVYPYEPDPPNPMNVRRRLIDAIVYTFGQPTGKPPRYTQGETEWIWVQTSSTGTTSGGFWGVGFSFIIDIFGGGDIGHEPHSVEVPVWPRESVPSTEGLEYDPKKELHGDPHKMPPNTQYIYNVSAASGLFRPVVRGVVPGEVANFEIRPMPSWPPWGAGLNVPVQTPGFIEERLRRRENDLGVIGRSTERGGGGGGGDGVKYELVNCTPLTLAFTRRADPNGNPLTECRRIHVSRFDDGTTVEVTWSTRDGPAGPDPETLTKDSRDSTCRCNNTIASVTLHAKGGGATISIQECEP